jgi:hypothetical protein
MCNKIHLLTIFFFICIGLSCKQKSTNEKEKTVTDSPETERKSIVKPPKITGPTTIRLIQSGAILAESFDGADVDRTRWRVWQNTPERSKVYQKDGRLNIEATGMIRMEGLWGLTTAKYKDVVLAADMYIRSAGPSPHQLCLHLCGSDSVFSPDNWVELQMVDLGDSLLFKPRASLPVGIDRREGQSLKLPFHEDKGMQCRVVLNGTTNLTELSVKTNTGWQKICDPIELPLRTIHAEVKLNGQQTSKTLGVTHSKAWFDNVRIYPRHESHHIGILLKGSDGGSVYFRDGWPPTITDPDGKERPITDLNIELRTADGMMVASVSAPTFGFYLLPLRDAPWDLYPVNAEIRILLDDKILGSPLKIERSDVKGLYPDDVYEVIMN